jgi:GLPGLI family protein
MNMKKLKSIYTLLALVLLSPVALIAQNFQGEATYQSVTQMKNFQIKMDGISPEMEAQLMETMKKRMQKEYTLKFNLTESTWEEVESLDAGPAASGGLSVQVSSAGGGGLMYKNTAEMKFMQEANVFSKPFLVEDVLENREWIMTDESRKIGNYTAYKATFINISERKTMSFGGDNDEMKTVTDTTEISAWYTPEIPVSQGPSTYWGLPGLILELSDGRTTYLCTKVSLNPADGIKIRVPSKGKKVNRKELAVITEEKSKEMMEKMSNGKNGQMQIKIGGN